MLLILLLLISCYCSCALSILVLVAAFVAVALVVILIIVAILVTVLVVINAACRRSCCWLLLMSLPKQISFRLTFTDFRFISRPLLFFPLEAIAIQSRRCISNSR